MAFAVIMPKAGMSMETGRVVRWLKKVGDPVNAGEPLLEIETDKVTMEVEAEVSGVLIQILCGPGEEVPVTNVIGYVGEPGERAEEPPRSSPAPAVLQPADLPRDSKTQQEMSRPASEGRRRIAATPLAQSLARESGIDIASVHATGARGEVKARDVLEARRGKAGGAMPPAAGRDALTAASFMTLIAEADVTDLMALRARVNEGLNAGTSITDWLIRAVALSIHDCPAVQRRLEGNERVQPDRVDIGIAAGADCSMVPVIRDADSLSARAISERLRQLIGKAGTGSLPHDDCTGATFTVTSLNTQDIIAFTPITNPAEGAALGAGCVRDSLALSEGKVIQRKVMYLSLIMDRRVIDGSEGARFLTVLRTYLGNPAALLA